ncbi:acylneuraminate cytidylyltransferase family protein [Cellulophaga baltica]|uniref:acylneuraminate cytidylyltransferase family protein n=1 Tax=Cellulophaga TaxID=104264 RepID=UPI001C07938B|nr:MULTISPECIES: acylneuraminate cytidylyltransferase family protein [Cellulophaga]MBU2995976.1 acylneuraminate cytidylyltransferase family protein [Cellulophaga baltica]MDO6767371.1 acylneuraminate cytidylyltransferase family protein [Cellulophaga sp. 1_MG-2023]
MKALVVIPARGGSKGVPGKNIKKLNGKQLINYTIEAARHLFEDKNIIVSTDDNKIKTAVEQSGLKVPFLRPAYLATDEANSYDVIMHTLKYYLEKGSKPEVIILLQPTSPFRTQKHITDALKLYNSSLDMVVSVKESSSNPYYNLFEEEETGYLLKSKKGKFTRRQDCPKVWEYNGAIYIINVSTFLKGDFSTFKKIKKYEMDELSSIDIDTKLDWKIAEYVIKE